MNIFIRAGHDSLPAVSGAGAGGPSVPAVHQVLDRVQVSDQAAVRHRVFPRELRGLWLHAAQHVELGQVFGVQEHAERLLRRVPHHHHHRRRRRGHRHHPLSLRQLPETVHQHRHEGAGFRRPIKGVNETF